jgi:hypothetical protein
MLTNGWPDDNAVSLPRFGRSSRHVSPPSAFRRSIKKMLARRADAMMAMRRVSHFDADAASEDNITAPRGSDATTTFDGFFGSGGLLQAEVFSSSIFLASLAERLRWCRLLLH